MSAKNLKSLIEYDLCYGCGVCAAICPNECIKMQIQPPGVFRRAIDESRCKQCGLCVKVCPAIGFNQGLSKNIQSCFLGHATDPKIRYRGSSGGLATSLLLYLLKFKYVEHVIVAGPLQVTEFGMLGRCILTSTTEQVVSYRGSTYAPMSIDRALRQVKDTAGKVAIVGLPCHLRGVVKATRQIPKLEKKVELTIGLVCNHISTGEGVKQVGKLMGIREPLVAVRFRGNGWPGASLFCGQSSSQRIPYLKWANAYYNTFLFSASSCLLCSDAGNEVADISLADPWPAELRRPGTGNTLAASRSEVGLKYLKLAEKNGYLKLEKVDVNAMRNQLKRNEVFKKIYIPYRWRLLGFPKDAPPVFPLSTLGRISAILNSWLIYTCLKGSTSRVGLYLIHYLPRSFFVFIAKINNFFKKFR